MNFEVARPAPAMPLRRVDALPPPPDPKAVNTYLTAGVKRRANAMDDDDGDDSTTTTTTTTTPAPASQGAWRPRCRNVGDIVDPFVCPGFNHDCFHAMVDERGYFDHVARAHNYTRVQLQKPQNAAILDNFNPPRRMSWFQAQGFDTTYRGSDPKQKAAARRREAGIRSNQPDYINFVYLGGMGKEERRRQREQAEQEQENGGGGDDEDDDNENRGRRGRGRGQKRQRRRRQE